MVRAVNPEQSNPALQKPERKASKRVAPGVAPGKGDTQTGSVQSAAAPNNLDLDQLLAGFELTRVASHLLRRAHFRAEDIYSSTVGDLGLTPRQKALLIAAYRHPGANQSELADMIALDPNSLAEMASRMVRDGLLRRTRSAEDARSKCVRITEQGIALLLQIMPLDFVVEKDVLAPIAPEHRPMFVQCLRQMVGIDKTDNSQ